MSYRALYAYAFDVAEEGLPATLDRLRRLGLDTLTLATAYHAGKFIRPRGTTGKVVFPEDGTLYFRPDPKRYGAIRPLTNSIVDRTDIVETFPLTSEARLNGWTVLLHNSALGFAHQDCVVRNAFGDPYFYSLCPSHPDVRAYAVAVCADLSSRPTISGLSLETPGFLPYVHGYHHEFQQIPLDPWLETLLALCFCEHCVARANANGIDALAIKGRVARVLDRFLMSDAAPPAEMGRHWLIADLVTDPDFAAFLKWRATPVTALVREIRAAMPGDKTLAVIPSVQRPSAAAWLEGTDHAALAAICDRIEVPLYEPSVERALADLHDVSRRVGDETKLRCILRPGPPDCAGEGQLVSLVAALKARGVTELGFYNYGLLRPHNLDWIGTALHA